jgi:ariadne-1
MVTDAEEVSPTASSSELEQEDDDDDCYLSDQEDDALEESVLQVLEDERDEDCHWSSTSVITKESLLAAQVIPRLERISSHSISGGWTRFS